MQDIMKYAENLIDIQFEQLFSLLTSLCGILALATLNSTFLAFLHPIPVVRSSFPARSWGLNSGVADI